MRSDIAVVSNEGNTHEVLMVVEIKGPVMFTMDIAWYFGIRGSNQVAYRRLLRTLYRLVASGNLETCSGTNNERVWYIPYGQYGKDRTVPE